MKNINTVAVAMHAAGAGRALGSVFAAQAAHAATPAHATAPAAAAHGKRRTASATATFVDGDPI
jgi:hypothetical protein